MENKNGIGYYIRAQRLRELSDTITAGIIARRYARTDTEREQINKILERAYAEKYDILGV